MTVAEWLDEGTLRFGPNQMDWRFVCPSCGYVAAVRDWEKVGAEEGEVAFSCVGRHMPNAKEILQRPGPCNYAGGGLIRLNPVDVDGHRVFAFAEVV